MLVYLPNVKLGVGEALVSVLDEKGVSVFAQLLDALSAVRADNLLANGDIEGMVVWRAIVRAIEDLR